MIDIKQLENNEQFKYYYELLIQENQKYNRKKKKPKAKSSRKGNKINIISDLIKIF